MENLNCRLKVEQKMNSIERTFMRLKTGGTQQPNADAGRLKKLADELIQLLGKKVA